MDIRNNIFNVTEESFEKLAIGIFHLQAERNKVYRQYVKSIGASPQKVNSLKEIPFLPIELFKSYLVIAEGMVPAKTFKSSGTSASGLSRHPVADISLYEESFKKGFEHFFGNINQYCILALLPSYLEQGDSSLVYMVNNLINRSDHRESAFYLHNTDELAAKLAELDKKDQKTILLGVTYALLDFSEKHKLYLDNIIIMETGGMKGKKKEMVREQVHDILCKALGVKTIYSEYGMTELLSQAYSRGKGLFHTPPWMKIMIRNTEDPMQYLKNEKTGGINIIDLANIYSCSFIATQDLGKIHDDGSFEVLGRFDNSDLRGCNLLVE